MIATKHVVVVGAGIGGLVAAIDLAAAGLRVTVLERAAAPGGKVRQVTVGSHAIDAGPATLTLRWVFDAIFAQAGAAIDDHLVLRRATTLGRHAWAGDQHLDIFADPKRTADAIGAFAGARDAAGFLALSKQARRMYKTLEHRFIRAPLPQGMDFVLAAGPVGLARLHPFRTLWSEIGRHMADPRLRQLFGQLATTHGSSPFEAPAALLALVHAEQAGLWMVEGGMQRLVEALAALATRLGATIRTEAGVKEINAAGNAAAGVRLENGESIRADAVIMNGEPSALAAGLLGRGVTKASNVSKFPQRSLSATNWAIAAHATGMPLLRRTTCHSRDTRQEFDLIGAGRLPIEPTITITAQDRPDHEDSAAPDGPERLLLGVSAPPSGDRRAFVQVEIDQCMQGMTALMQRCGIELRLTETPVMTTPSSFHRMFPASGGSLYGAALSGPGAAFNRPGARTKVDRLYLAGGGTHPGPGPAFAALSGRHAAAAALKDLAPRPGALARLLRRPPAPTPAEA